MRPSTNPHLRRRCLPQAAIGARAPTACDGRANTAAKKLADRKAKTHCVACGEKGHWKGDPECKKRGRQPQAAIGAPAPTGRQPPPPALPATGSNPGPSTNPHLAARPSATPKSSDPTPPWRGGTGGRGAKGGGGRNRPRGGNGGGGRGAKGGGGHGAKGGGGRETNRDRLLAFSLIAHLRQRNRRPVRFLADALGCSADDVRWAVSLCPDVLALRGEILELLE